MEFTFQDALEELGKGFAVRIANETRPPAEYVLSRILPSINQPDYQVESGSLTIRPTMAGHVAMDSPYPNTGKMTASTFLENTAKIANKVPFSERALRKLQDMIRRIQLSGGSSKEQMVQEVLNFTSKVIVQAHIDTEEYLRGQALAYGQIDWTFGDQRLLVDYGIPADNVFDTATGTEAYGGADSTFWADHRAAIKQLGYSYNGPYLHPNTMDALLENPDANNIELIDQTDSTFTLQKYIGEGTNFRLSNDRRDRVTITLYGMEGEVIDDTNPQDTRKVPFFPPGRIVYTGTGSRNAYRVGEGATEEYTAEQLGYTHIAPTVEGDAMGRWADVYTPEDRPWQLIGRGVTNLLPVIEEEEDLVILSTEL